MMVFCRANCAGACRLPSNNISHVFGFASRRLRHSSSAAEIEKTIPFSSIVSEEEDAVAKFSCRAARMPSNFLYHFSRAHEVSFFESRTPSTSFQLKLCGIQIGRAHV